MHDSDSVAKEYQHRSLCKVEKNDRIWLLRLADYSGDVWTKFKSNPKQPYYFDNRDRLYRKDGPVEDGYIGVWDWNATPLYGAPDRDYIVSAFCPDVSPIEVVVFPGEQDMKSLIAGIHTGMKISPVVKKVLLSIHKSGVEFDGLLISSSQLVSSGEKVVVSKEVTALPLYSFKAEDVIELENWKFLRHNSPGPCIEMIVVADPLDVVRREFLNRLTWKYAKENGVLKKDWSAARNLMESINTIDFEQCIMKQCGCPQDQAKEYISAFLLKAEQYLRFEDVDSKLLEEIAWNHAAMRQKCLDLLRDQWEADYQQRRYAAEQQEAALREEIKKLIQQKNDVVSEYAAMREELSSADENMRKKQELADAVERNVAKRIEAARKDAASFLSEMAFWSPAVSSKQPESIEKRPSRTVVSYGVEYDSDAVEMLSTWKDLLDALCDNLSEAGVTERFRYPLGAYLYSCYLSHTPLLLAGPFGREIADALSCVLIGRKADYIDCSLHSFRRGMDEIRSMNRSILVLDHPFVKDWTDHIAEISALENCYIVYSHPFREDLLIEPRGMTNYMVPIMTELLLDRTPERNYFGCHFEQSFHQYKQNKPTMYYQKLLQRMRVNPFVLNKLSRILTDYHGMCVDQRADNDYVLCLAPMAYLMGGVDALTEELEKRDKKATPISNEVSTLLLQMMGDNT